MAEPEFAPAQLHHVLTEALYQRSETLSIISPGHGHYDIIEVSFHSRKALRHGIHFPLKNIRGGCHTKEQPIEAEEATLRVDGCQLLRILVQGHLVEGISKIQCAETNSSV